MTSHHYRPLATTLHLIDCAAAARYREAAHLYTPAADRVAALPLASDRIAVTSGRARVSHVAAVLAATNAVLDRLGADASEILDAARAARAEREVAS